MFDANTQVFDEVTPFDDDVGHFVAERVGDARPIAQSHGLAEVLQTVGQYFDGDADLYFFTSDLIEIEAEQSTSLIDTDLNVGPLLEGIAKQAECRFGGAFLEFVGCLFLERG
jgi:hypothetical protein